MPHQRYASGKVNRGQHGMYYGKKQGCFGETDVVGGVLDYSQGRAVDGG